MPYLSIIVPVYNVENYIKKCMDSILAQTLQDIEIICVDDGSTDASGEILDQLAECDKRVRVLHRANAGYGATMNAGLDAATGEYIGIVESDDCILPQMYEKLYEAAVENELDMVKSDAFYWIESEDFICRKHIKALDAYYDQVLDPLDRSKFFEFYMNIWTGIYKRSFLLENQIRFHESAGASYQDNGFWMQTCIYAKRAMWLNQAFYLYRQDNPTASVKSQGKMLAMTYEYDYLEKVLRDRGHEQYLPYCHCWRLIRDIGCINRISDELKEEFCKQIAQDYEKCAPTIQKLTYINDYLVSLIRNPKERVEELIAAKKVLADQLQNAKRIVIYGAGLHGETVFRILFNEGWMDKVSCMAVTKDLSKPVVGKKLVKDIDAAVRENQEALYIIAVAKGTNAYKEMSQKLESLGIENYISGSDIEQNFYIA